MSAHTPAPQEPDATRIVVGVDRSPEARAAAEWAAEQAVHTDAALELVHAYRLPLAYAGTGEDPALVLPPLHREAQALVDEVVAGLRQQHPGLRVEAVVAAGEAPAHALIRRSAGAQLLVIGPRGDGGLDRLHLGSVAFHCAHHAACPVVIVRNGG